MSLTLWGTPSWMAPEVYLKDGHAYYNIQSDTFSSGLLYLTLVDHEKGKSLKARTGNTMLLHICDISVIVTVLFKMLSGWIFANKKSIVKLIISKFGDAT